MSVLPMGRTGLPSTSAAGITASSGKRHALLFQVSGGVPKAIADIKPEFGPLRQPGGGAPVPGIVVGPHPPAPVQHGKGVLGIKAVLLPGGVGMQYEITEQIPLLDGQGNLTRAGFWSPPRAPPQRTKRRWNPTPYSRAHKLSKVEFGIPMKDGKEDYMTPWRFTSDDGRFEMERALTTYFPPFPRNRTDPAPGGLCHRPAPPCR